MTKTPTARKPRKAKAKPSIDAKRLTKLATEVDALLAHHRENLIHRLQTEEGMVMTEKDGRTEIDLAGVVSAPAEGEITALANWANAARRAVLRGAA